MIKKFKNYFANLVIIWLVLLLYKNLNYYQNFLRQETQTSLFILALAYTILGFFYYLFIPQEKINKTLGINVFSFLKKIIYNPIYYIKHKKIFSPIEKEERTAFLFALVKIFFLPIMINFVFGNYFALKSQIPFLLQIKQLDFIEFFNFILFPIFLTLVFFLDTLWFSFGYAFESKKLKNKIRSVEPTLFGWAVAVACYPPFNSIIGKYIPWFPNDYVFFFNNSITFTIRILIVILLGIYLSATLALGAKSSNLTNRGIVSKGPYSIIRHPAYISKNLAWLLTIIPIFSWIALLSVLFWALIYHLRTITEEKHLSKDLDYIQYCKKVKYRYVPGIY